MQTLWEKELLSQFYKWINSQSGEFRNLLIYKTIRKGRHGIQHSAFDKSRVRFISSLLSHLWLQKLSQDLWLTLTGISSISRILLCVFWEATIPSLELCCCTNLHCILLESSYILYCTHQELPRKWRDNKTCRSQHPASLLQFLDSSPILITLDNP